MQWAVFAAQILLEVALAALMGVRLTRFARRRPVVKNNVRAADAIRVVFGTLAVVVASSVLLFYAGWLFFALGPQAGGLAAAIFLAHAVLFPIVWLACLRMWQVLFLPADGQTEKSRIWDWMTPARDTAETIIHAREPELELGNTTQTEDRDPAELYQFTTDEAPVDEADRLVSTL